jgi:hypothetical protein
VAVSSRGLDRGATFTVYLPYEANDTFYDAPLFGAAPTPALPVAGGQEG